MTKVQSKTEPSDLAFEKFRQIFPGSTHCLVNAEGTRMQFRLPHLRSAMLNLHRAQEVITEYKLPLTATVLSKGWPASFILTISYKNQQ